MSLERPVELNCPECDHAQHVIVWSSLNAQVSPEAKSDFFNGKINVFECEKCGTHANLGAPFLYHDMVLQFCIQYYPPESIGDEETLGIYNLDGTSSMDLFGAMEPTAEILEKTKYMLRPHIVFSMQEALLYAVFREKLAAFHSPQE